MKPRMKRAVPTTICAKPTTALTAPKANGLFALAEFKPNDVLCLYSGDQEGAPVPAVKAGNTEEVLAYACSVRKITEKAAFHWSPGCQGVFTNTPHGTKGHSNAVFTARDRRIVLVAKRKICVLNEILMGYGSGYWANMRTQAN
eukprot:m51a1_g3565 hypothetical protein (144) ;mRNA; f:1071683-1075250